jgi:hypothetical protein
MWNVPVMYVPVTLTHDAYSRISELTGVGKRNVALVDKKWLPDKCHVGAQSPGTSPDTRFSNGYRNLRKTSGLATTRTEWITTRQA